jgi:hypothetical protein
VTTFGKRRPTGVVVRHREATRAEKLEVPRPAFSGHRTASMLKRYDIIDVDDLRRAAERASSYQGEPATVVPLRAGEDEKTDRTPAGEPRG